MGADPLPRRCKRLGFGPRRSSLVRPADDGEQATTGSEGWLPSTRPHSALLPGATQGAGTSLAVPLEFAAPLEFLGTHFFGLCCSALVRHSFENKSFRDKAFIFP